MELTPDQIVYWQWGAVRITATLVSSWVVMAILVAASWLATRRVTLGPAPSRWQSFLEAVVEALREQIRGASGQDPAPYLPFVGTLFLYIATANLLSAVPGLAPPTASLATTAALAACVFFAVPIYGVARLGLRRYLARYLQPTPFMLPFNVLGELSRTAALAIRLFGNMASGTLIVAVLLAVAPLFFPVIMELLGLLIGFIQAYVFAMLALIYIASAARVQEEPTVAARTAAAGGRRHRD